MHEGGRGFRRSRLSRRVNAELVTHVGTEPVGRAQLFRDLHRQVLLETTLHVEHRPLVQLGQRLRLELPCFALDLRTLGVTLRADRGILAHGHGQGAGDAPATPSMRLAVDTMASSEPSTAARRHTDALHPAADASRSFLRDVRSGASADRAPAGADHLLVARASDDVRRLSAVMKEGRAQLDLLAPFDGTIVRRDGEVGQVVGPESTIFEIATVDAPRVAAEVDERYMRALRVGMRAEISPVASNEAGVPAKVSYVAQAVDPQTGAGTVRFAYESAPSQVLVGLSVDVNISIDTRPSAVTIPRESVGGGGDRPFVLLVTDGRVTRRDVTIEDWPAPLVVVRAGLEQGDQILVDPTSAEEGSQVRSTVRPNAL